VTAVLHGVRVLDFGRYIAGPYCAALLAEYGAEVIRVERRGGGEDRAVAPVAPSGDGALFLQMNRNKLSLTLDPMVDEGREIVRRLVATADVVVANLPPAALAAMRLDYASLRAVKPDVILTTVSAYGSAGPLSERLGFDGVGQAMCGAVYMGGEPGRPSRAAVSWVDFATALHAAFGTLMALMSRARTGAGQVVEAALLPTAVALNGVTLIEQALLQRDRQPTANRGQYSAPSNVFRTRDGWILCQVFGNAMFGRWGALMGEERWGTDPRFRDDISRGDNGAAICDRMGTWCAERTTADALAALEGAGIPGAAVLTPQEVLDDRQVQATGVFEALEFPGLARAVPVPRAPVWLSETPGTIRRRAPLLGEHTDVILADLGYGSEAIAELHRKGVV
jgi:crotonobetainyl-CoA:carnitine CoA-transferase CaiB-like acyl-CoA transferase